MRPTSANQLEALRSGELPAVEEVRPGLFAVPVDMVGAQPPYTLCYVFVDDAGGRRVDLVGGAVGRRVDLVDTGIDTEENWLALCAALEGLGLRIEDVASVTVTHLHHDHLGLAARVQAASGARVRMHAVEAAAVRDRAAFARGDAAGTLERWGVPAEYLEPLRDAAERSASAGAAGVSTGAEIDFETVADGEELVLGRYTARVLHTPGHTAGHICLAVEEAGLVLTGDHVLPVINPGIGLGGRRAADPLGQYYDSLDRVAALGDVEALPGHFFRFAGAAERCTEIRAHHEARTRETAAILAGDPALSVWELASRITWTDGWENLGAVSRLSALGQAEMHALRVRALG